MARPRVDFALVKERASFSAVLDRYAIKHRPGAAQITVCCPFHDDRVPSLSINTEKRLFHCFSCDAAGDIIEFVARIEGCSTASAARLLAEWSGVPLEAGQPNARPVRKPSATGRQQALRNPGPAAERTRMVSVGPNKRLLFRLTLDPTHPYLKERGLSHEVIETFGLGYCDTGSLRGRIAIPIYDESGRLVAYAGRWPSDNIPKDVKRYRLPRGFEKNAVLFNHHRVKGAEHLVIVEGYWSVFRLHALGMSAVALMGCSLSEEQERLLITSGARRLTLLLDGDEPGRTATEEILPRLTKEVFVRAPSLESSEAPDIMSHERLTALASVP